MTSAGAILTDRARYFGEHSTVDYTKPLLKRSHHVLIADDGSICIGEIPGKSKVIESPPAWVAQVLSKLDGDHTKPRIVKEIRSEFVDVSENDVNEFIAALGRFGLIEDSARYSNILTTDEVERYDRQILQFSLVDEDRVENAIVYQERLKAAKILVLGMGGWGTWCSIQLARAGVGTIRIVDGDDVELSNLNRQVLYDNASLGQKKVDVAARTLKMHNPHVAIETFYEFAIPEQDRLEQLVDGMTFIVLAWASLGYYRQDTVERIVHRIASERSIPVIELGGDPLDISVGPVYLNDGSHPSFEEIRSKAQSSFYSEDNRMRSFQEARLKNQFANGSRKVNAWQSSPSLGLMAGIVGDQVVKAITKYDKCNLIGRRFHMSLRSYECRFEDLFI